MMSVVTTVLSNVFFFFVILLRMKNKIIPNPTVDEKWRKTSGRKFLMRAPRLIKSSTRVISCSGFNLNFIGRVL